MSIDMTKHATVMEELQPGDTTRVNHEDCTAGEDIRRRLYLTRVMAKPDLVIGYCHNCQKFGQHRTGSYSAYRVTKHDSTALLVSVVATLTEPKHIDRRMKDWPVCAKAWAITNGITQDDTNLYGIGYDPSTNRVYLPRYGHVTVTPSSLHRFNGYQLRLLEGEGPKYTTVVHENDKGYSLLEWEHMEPDTGIAGVVVEDLASGIAIVKAMEEYDVSVLVNYGTKINIEAVHALRAYQDVSVWLDNDSPHVKQQAKHYARTIGLYSGKETRIITDLKDPKYYDKNAIINAFERIWKT